MPRSPVLTRRRKRERDIQPQFNASSDELGEKWRFQLSPDIRSGYRLRLNWFQTAISLFKFHNETMNIWTHLLGAILFCVFFCYIPTAVPSTAPNTLPHATMKACGIWHQTALGIKTIMAKGNLTELRDYVSIKLFCMGGGASYSSFEPTLILPACTPNSSQYTNTTHCYKINSTCHSGVEYHSSESFMDMIKQSFASQSHYNSDLYNRSIANLGTIVDDIHAMDDFTLIKNLRESFSKFREALPDISAWGMLNASLSMDVGAMPSVPLDLENYAHAMANYTQQFANMSSMSTIGEQVDTGMQEVQKMMGLQDWHFQDLPGNLTNLTGSLSELQQLSNDLKEYLSSDWNYMDMPAMPKMTMTNMTMARMMGLPEIRQLSRMKNLSELVDRAMKQMPHLNLSGTLPPVPHLNLNMSSMTTLTRRLDWVEMWPNYNKSSSSFISGQEVHALERWPIYVFLTTAVVCMVFSSLFHLLYCRSLEVYKFMVRLDYSGVALLISGSYFPWLYYSFYCSSNWQIFYLTTVVILGFITFCISLFEFFSDPRFNEVRVAVFISFGAFCVVPTLHVLYNNSWDIFSESVRLNIGPTLMMECAAYFTGAMVFLFRLPERWTKGTTDVFGSSHQIWHMFVIIGGVLHFKMCVEQYDYRQQHMCSSVL